MTDLVDAKRKIFTVRALPTLPIIAQKILGLSSEDEFLAEKLRGIISRDQSLSVKVLALANSAYYGYRAQIGTIKGALVVIGTALLRQFTLGVFESDPMYIRADDSQVEQILLNLAINARDAMPDGGSLSIDTTRVADQVSLRIADTGSGISPDILPNIFDPFFTTKDKSHGTGLGLSVVYSLVKQIGGTIDVRSELGKGSEFLLRFPAFVDAAHLPLLKLAPPAAGNEHILIVDDEPEIRSLLETLLQGIGYRVACANNGMEAVERVSSAFQLVIMDMMIPVMDGLTAVHAIREKLPEMKILVASGYTTPENVPMLRNMRIEGFVQKPFELHKLAHLIRDVLDGAAA